MSKGPQWLELRTPKHIGSLSLHSRVKCCMSIPLTTMNADHGLLEPIVDTIAKVVQAKDISTNRATSLFRITEGCGTMAIAFLALVLLQKMLPVTPEDIRQVHEYLKAVFCREYFAGDFCIKPWLWGNGIGSSKNHQGNIESHAQRSKVVANMPSPVPCLSPCSANARPTAAPETASSVTQFCPNTAHAMHPESIRPVCQFHATACVHVAMHGIRMLSTSLMKRLLSLSVHGTMLAVVAGIILGL